MCLALRNTLVEMTKHVIKEKNSIKIVKALPLQRISTFLSLGFPFLSLSAQIPILFPPYQRVTNKFDCCRFGTAVVMMAAIWWSFASTEWATVSNDISEDGTAHR